MAEGSVALALDVGATKLAAAVVDDGGTVLGASRGPVSHTEDGDGLLAALLGHAAAAMDPPQVTPAALAGVGIACAGPMDWERGEVSPLNLPAWRGFPLAARVGEALGGVPVALENDAVGIAAGEAWMGAGRGLGSFMAVTVSSGIGGGLVLDGRLVHGASRNAGHVGHIVVEPDGPQCVCGGRGCLEAIASGPRTVERALERGWRPAGGDADGIALAAAAGSGDGIAREEIGRAGRALGVAFASAAALLDLEAILVVGGFSRSGDALWQPLRDEFARYAGLSFARTCRIAPGELGDNAGLMGAAALILDSPG